MANKFTPAQVRTGTAAGTGSGNTKLHSSSGIVNEKGANGQTVKRAFPLDCSDMELPNERGGSLGGSTSNLGHSLTGPSAVQGVAPGGKKSPYIPNH